MKLTKWTLGAALAVALWGRGASAQQDEYYLVTAPMLGGVEAVIADDGSLDHERVSARRGSARELRHGLGGDGGAGAATAAAAASAGPAAARSPTSAKPTSCGRRFSSAADHGRRLGGSELRLEPVPTRRISSTVPMTWNDRANEYQMNELYYYFGRAAKTEGCARLGCRTDTLYGTNYRWNTSAGFETHFGNSQFYGLAVPQLYGEMAYNDLTIKVGRLYFAGRLLHGRHGEQLLRHPALHLPIRRAIYSHRHWPPRRSATT